MIPVGSCAAAPCACRSASGRCYRSSRLALVSGPGRTAESIVAVVGGGSHPACRPCRQSSRRSHRSATSLIAAHGAGRSHGIGLTAFLWDRGAMSKVLASSYRAVSPSAAEDLCSRRRCRTLLLPLTVVGRRPLSCWRGLHGCWDQCLPADRRRWRTWTRWRRWRRGAGAILVGRLCAADAALKIRQWPVLSPVGWPW